MQWLSVVAIWIAMVGGLAAYLALRGAPETAQRRQLAINEAVVEAELRCTADLGGAADPFAADPGAAVDAAVLRWGGPDGEERRAVIGRLVAGVPRRLTLEGLVAGRNEVLLEVAAPGEAAALQIAVTRDGEPVAERTMWLEAGAPLVTSLHLDLAPAGDRAHDH